MGGGAMNQSVRRGWGGVGYEDTRTWTGLNDHRILLFPSARCGDVPESGKIRGQAHREVYAHPQRQGQDKGPLTLGNRVRSDQSKDPIRSGASEKSLRSSLWLATPSESRRIPNPLAYERENVYLSRE